uniref:Uncharacterized protein n=1 Tax=Rhizophora mucronata TaxID=61149 RepID=A0A2P2NJ75_RHIMU
MSSKNIVHAIALMVYNYKRRRQSHYPQSLINL